MNSFIRWLTGFWPGAINIGLLILRIMIGVAFMTHGYSKFFGEGGINQFAGFLSSMHIPAPLFMAYIVGLTELAGGFFIAIGLLVRPASLAAAIDMLVALNTAHAGQAFDKKELPYLYLASFIFMLFAGGGSFSVDKLFNLAARPKREKKK
jgi:putative oxidoreductase